MANKQEGPVPATRIIQGELFYSIGASADYCQMSRSCFESHIRLFNAAHTDWPIQKMSYPGTRAILIAKRDLDRMMQLTPIEEE